MQGASKLLGKRAIQSISTRELVMTKREGKMWGSRGKRKEAHGYICVCMWAWSKWDCKKTTFWKFISSQGGNASYTIKVLIKKCIKHKRQKTPWIPKKGLETSTRYDASNTMHSCFALSRSELHLVFPKVLFRIQLGRISTSIIDCGTCQEFHSRNANHDVI